MKPSASCGSPGTRRPTRSGSVITARAWIRRPSSSSSSPASAAIARARAMNSTPRASRSGATAVEAVGAEGLQRRGLGRGHHDLCPHPALAQARGGEDRQLVERQRPEGAEGHRERDRAAVARLHVVQRGADGGGVAPAAEGDRAGQGADGAGADADEQRVVGQPTRVCRDGLVAVGLDRRQGVANEPHVLVGGEALELHAPGGRAVERLEDGERAVLEAVARGTAGRCSARPRRGTSAGPGTPRGRRRRRRR